jgi:hypothetical protein
VQPLTTEQKRGVQIAVARVRMQYAQQLRILRDEARQTYTVLREELEAALSKQLALEAELQRLREQHLQVYDQPESIRSARALIDFALSQRDPNEWLQ